MPYTHIQEHIELIARHEQEFLDKRSRAECISDSISSFVATFRFVIAHICVFALWVMVNTLRIPGVRHFDPRPFSLLATIVGLEAILLVSFILMRQNRQARRSEERDHLMLQLLLISEKEITAILRMERQMADRLGLEKAANSPEVRELSKTTQIERVAQTIKEALPSTE
jgi:uncharacterized membrane protein